MILYTGLHQHTVYSLLDGYCKIPDLVKKAKENEFSAVCITDHNLLSGIPQLKNECSKENIKPIFGVEGYFTPKIEEMMKPVKQRNEEAEANAIKLMPEYYTKESIEKMKSKDKIALHKEFGYDMDDFHILFMAKDQEGWKNLVKLQSESSRLCTFNGRYHCDYDLIAKYHKGIICTSACIGSYPAQRIGIRRYKEANDYIKKMVEIFGDDFYLEIQPATVDLQRKVNLYYMRMAKVNNIKVIATNDSHWINKDDNVEHDVLLCIGTGKKVSDLDRMRYSPEFWVRNKEEMIEAFDIQVNKMREESLIDNDEKHLEYTEFYQEALNNTQEIVDKIDNNITLGSDKPLFTAVKLPEGVTPEEELTDMAYKGLEKFLEKHPEVDRFQYASRLSYELNIINKKGYAPYFLTVKEYVNWCEENNVSVGPGRGSAAASLVLLCIGITKRLDPIKYNLLFGRFLTADRTSPPDVDLDFSNLRRDDLIHHLEDYYGQEKVAHIGTYNTLKVKSALKDVARVLDLPFKESLAISKTIDEITGEDPNASFKSIDEMADGNEAEQLNYAKFKELENKYKDIFKYARKFEGIPRQLGVHASGILVTPIPINDYVPLYYPDGVAVTLYEGPQLEEENFIKYDILGVKTLDVVDLTLKFINKGITLDDLYNKTDIDDPKIYSFIRTKETEGLFQIESNMMKGLIDKIEPTTFEDMSAILSLGRPGPLGAGAHLIYANGKKGEDHEESPMPGCEDIFSITFGATVYQEQLMQVSKKVAGFDDNQADSITRKILGKKKVELMPMLKRCHIYGKLNCEGPKGWETNDDLPWYDPKGKYGKEIEGGLKRGYKKEDILAYFDKISEFAKYSFNKAHTAAYGLLSVLTAYLKLNYPTEFMAALLTIHNDKEEKRKKYIDCCVNQMKIKVKAPDINKSKASFEPFASKKTILYGLSSVRGLGKSGLAGIMEDRETNGEYASLENFCERLPKNIAKKNVVINLIAAGCFDFENDNRYELMNQFLDLRKDKGDRYPALSWTKEECIKLETETLGIPLTVKPYWSSVKPDKKVEEEAEIISIREQTDKNGRLMAFAKLMIRNSEVDAVIFASTYAKFYDCFDKTEKKTIKVLGKKDDRGQLIINKAARIIEPDLDILD